MRKTHYTPLIVLLTLLACGGEPKESAPDASPRDAEAQLSRLDFCRASAEILCDAWADCCAASAEREAKQGAYERCFAYAYSENVDCIPALPILGRIDRYESERGGACLDELRAAFDVNQCTVNQDAVNSGPECRVALISDPSNACDHDGCSDALLGDPCASGTECDMGKCVDGVCKGQMEMTRFCEIMDMAWYLRENADSVDGGQPASMGPLLMKGRPIR